MTDTRHSALHNLYSSFLQMCEQIDTIPTQAGRERVKAQCVALGDAIETYTKEVEHNIETKDRVNKVILALVTKHWKGYTRPHRTIAQQAASGEQMDRLVLEFERMRGQNKSHFPLYDFMKLTK